jgi:hypothetical protein
MPLLLPSGYTVKKQETEEALHLRRALTDQSRKGEIAFIQ